MDRSLSKAERTRKFIIESTAEIFNKKGYAGTSMSDLTEATGLTKGSIYGNFENKEEVALAVFDYNSEKVKNLISEQISRAASYHDKLMVYAKVYKNVTKGFITQGGCPILNTAIEADDTHNLLKDRAAKAVIKWKKSITDLIEGGVAAGEFKQDIEIPRTALSIIALIEGAVMISRVTNDLGAMDKILKTVEAVIDELKVA
ncbi:TetR/AcrR family transcriptional regulator [Mucilaginibacter gynuensis]|uniref:TetR/AcrR family transcriptional regulator n=1 Tax=Mucilaginibacter gynuensis TaxID=1302236 RepID=A0ABP8HEY0_9SPHI